MASYLALIFFRGRFVFFSLSLGLKQDQSCLARQPGAELSGSWCHFARNVMAVLGNSKVSNRDPIFSTSHVIPHIRALVPCPGLTSEDGAVASTSVPLTPTEILNLVFL